MDKKDDTDPSLNTRRNSNQRRTPKFRGNFHGHSNRVRGNFSSHWSHRGGGGGRFDGSNQHQKNENNHNNCPTFNDQFSNYGISYKKIEDICNDLDNHKILSGSSELLTAVQVESFYHRLNDLWPDIKKQSNFLRVIVATASTNQADLLNLTYEFVTKIFESKIIDTIVEKCICPLMYDTNMQKDSIYAEISFHTVKLLLLGFHLLPSKMDQHLPKVQNVITSLKHISLKEETVIQLERLEIALKDRHETKASLRLTTQTQKQKGKIFEGSTGEPPINFRHISVVPIPEDISHQYPPYLRAAKFLGKYDSDEQYLDIQFRLLREDLIRPLRKGIEGYRKGGKKESDLFVFNDVELGASTIDKKSGELISFAHITISKRMRWDKRLKFGSLVCLSSDDFQKVFLFATVIEREELAKGKVGLKFEEISKINTKWKYKMVESPAFFEAYKHVMMALQISFFVH
uniref:ZNFX1 domain-containing protein n=1 Tax=Panagrolaimus superbus TaxID=310955 RepID=A0A914Y556_9BILA